MKNIGIYNNLIRPIITAKSYKLINMNKYSFISKMKLNKNIIKRIVKLIFNMRTNALSSMRCVSKSKNFRGVRGKRVSLKKFYTTISKR